jgi:hypothetical protein
MYPVPSHFCCSFLGTISNGLSYQPLSRRRHNRSVLRRKALLLSAAAIALAGTGAGVVLATHGGSARAVRTTGDMPGEASQASGKKTYAQLVAANYKILKPQQSTRLLRYADAAFACMSQDLELGKPRASPTKIVMTLPSATKPSAVIRSMGRCATKIGDPPVGSSFQLRKHAVIVYLPRYCILDKKTTAHTAALPHP